MGQCCSGKKGDEKKKAEGELEELDIAEVKIPNFDSAFSQTKDPANNVVNVNNGIVGATRKLGELLGLVPPPPFAVAIKEFFANIKAAAPEALKSLKLNVNLDALSEGKIDLDPSFDFDPIKVLPEKLQKAWEAIFGEEGLIAQIKKAVGNFLGIKTQLEEAKTAVEALPTGADEIKAAAEGAGIGGMDLLKVPGKIAGNIKQAARVPDILKTFLETIKTTVTQLQDAFKALQSGDAAAASATLAPSEKKE